MMAGEGVSNDCSQSTKTRYVIDREGVSDNCSQITQTRHVKLDTSTVLFSCLQN